MSDQGSVRNGFVRNSWGRWYFLTYRPALGCRWGSRARLLAKFKSFVAGSVETARKNKGERVLQGDKSWGVLSNFVRLRRRVIEGSWCLVRGAEFNHNDTTDTTMETWCRHRSARLPGKPE